MKKKNIIALIMTFCTGFGLGFVCFREKIKAVLEIVISELIDNMVEEIYPCKLLLTVNYNQDDEQTIVDMSHYESNKIIGFTICKTESPQDDMQESINGISQIYSPAVVYKLGEHWFWKVL